MKESMSKYVGLYTRDKKRKRKRWVDCEIRVGPYDPVQPPESIKCEVFDDETGRQVTHAFVSLPPSGIFECDTEFTTEQWLVQFREQKAQDGSAIVPLKIRSPAWANRTDLSDTVGKRPTKCLTAFELSAKRRKKFTPPAAIESTCMDGVESSSGIREGHAGRANSSAVPWVFRGLLRDRYGARKFLEDLVDGVEDDSAHFSLRCSPECTNIKSTKNIMTDQDMVVGTTAGKFRGEQTSEHSQRESSFRRSAKTFHCNLMNSKKASTSFQLPAREKALSDSVPHRSSKSLLDDFSFVNLLTNPNETLLYSNATISQTFEDIKSYLDAMARIVHQEIVLGLVDSAQRFWDAAKRFELMGLGAQNPYCDCKNTPRCLSVSRQVHKEGPNKGRMFFSCSKPKNKGCGFFSWASNPDHGAKRTTNLPLSNRSTDIQDIRTVTRVTRMLVACVKEESSRLETSFRNLGVSFYANGKIARRKPAKNVPGASSSYYFTPDSASTQETHNVSMNDLWIITRSLSFSSCCVMRATFHGFSSQGTMQLAPIPGSRPIHMAMNGEITVHAVRAFNCASEFDILDCIETMRSTRPPILRPIAMPTMVDRKLQGENERMFRLSCSRQRLDEITEEIRSEFTLNHDQGDVLTLVQGWFTAADDEGRSNSQVVADEKAAAATKKGHLCPPLSTASSSPNFDSDRRRHSRDVILVHGCFGTGKSFMTVALLHFILRIIKEEEKTSGRSCGLRVLVASATNVAVDRVLKTLHETGYVDFQRVGVTTKVHKDLRRFLTKNASAAIVGSTLASCSSSSAMNGQSFPICFLDECSQQIEPSTLLSMNFDCKRALLVGDPLQLPPVTRFGNVTDRMSNGVSSQEEMSCVNRAMFVRLTNAGSETVMLRTQYRLHPILSAIPNELFYGGMLIDGVTSDDRKALVPGLPPLVGYDCRKGFDRKDVTSNSYSNEYEASVVCKLLRQLKSDNVDEGQIGIICLYKAQAEKIGGLLSSERTELTVPTTKKKNHASLIKVSTVDAFQGAERDIIILSTVRSTAPKLDRESFISSKTRMCVALSRAKRHLFVVGDLKMLRDTPVWSNVIKSIKMHGTIFQGERFLQGQ
jgi:hypothetical protein